MKLDKKLQRLTRWMLMFEQPQPLDLNHEAQKDIAWACDEILDRQNVIDTLKMDIQCMHEDISTLVLALRQVYSIAGEDENVARICNEILDSPAFAGYDA